MKKGLLIGMILLCFGTRALAQKFPGAKCTTLTGTAMFGKKEDTSKTRGVADNYHTWDPGTTLLIKFMPGGSKLLREKVMLNAHEWEKYANITLKFLPDDAGYSQVRIKLGQGLGHNSAVGTEANFRGQSVQTMNFDTLGFLDVDYYKASLKKTGAKEPYTYEQYMSVINADPDHWNYAELRRVVMHEFGHALGLLHEQSYPRAVNWKKTDSVYNYYWQTQGWDRDQVDFNVFNASSQFYTNGTTYDPKSIMHYSIESWQTIDGYSVKDNFELSTGDKSLIAALYPKANEAMAKVVPKVTITNFSKLSVVYDAKRQGLVVRPSFDMKTNSKLGEVYFVARLVDQDGYYIENNRDYYNWGGKLASYLKMNLMPNSKIGYNKTMVSNLELFFPFTLFPELYGRRIRVTFEVYLDDVANNQLDKLMYFSATNMLSIPRKQM